MSIPVEKDITYEELTRLLVNAIAEAEGEVVKFSWKKDGIIRECSFTMGMVQQICDIDFLVSFIWRDIESK